MDWLTKAFRLSRDPRARQGPDNKARHAEMALGETGVAAMGWPGPTYRNAEAAGPGDAQRLRADRGRGCPLRARHEKRGATVLEKPADQRLRRAPLRPSKTRRGIAGISRSRSAVSFLSSPCFSAGARRSR